MAALQHQGPAVTRGHLLSFGVVTSCGAEARPSMVPCVHCLTSKGGREVLSKLHTGYPREEHTP